MKNYTMIALRKITYFLTDAIWNADHAWHCASPLNIKSTNAEILFEINLHFPGRFSAYTELHDQRHAYLVKGRMQFLGYIQRADRPLVRFKNIPVL